MRMDRAPGLTVGFMKDNFVWTRGFGFSDLENSVRAVPESAYRLASITKTMTAIAVLRLAEQGKVDLEADQPLQGLQSGRAHQRSKKYEGGPGDFSKFRAVSQAGNTL